MRPAMLSLLVVAAMATAGVQGPSSGSALTVVPGAAKNVTAERGDDPSGSKAFILFNERGDLPISSAGACVGTGDLGSIQVRAHRYDLNNQMGKMLHDNILQYNHPRTTLENRKNDQYDKSTDAVTVKPMRRIPIDGGELIIQDVIDNSNCNVERNFTVYSTFVAAYWIGGGAFAEIDLTVRGASPTSDVAQSYVAEVVKKLKAAKW